MPRKKYKTRGNVIFSRRVNFVLGIVKHTLQKEINKKTRYKIYL